MVRLRTPKKGKRLRSHDLIVLGYISAPFLGLTVVTAMRLQFVVMVAEMRDSVEPIFCSDLFPSSGYRRKGFLFPRIADP